MKLPFNSVQIFKPLFFTCFFFSSLFCIAQQNEIVAKLVKEGVELHDKGDYEAAITKFDRALILAPDDYEANYEKSSSCLYAGKYDESIALSKYLLEKHKDNPAIKGAYVNYGSAYDDKGNTDSAIIAYNEGLKRFPDFYLLHFNKGLTYARWKKWDEALPDFLAALKIKPTHAGSLYYASMAMEESNTVATIISGLAFLAVEPEGKRAKNMYEYISELFQSYTRKRGEIGKPRTTKIENDFSRVNQRMILAIGASQTDSMKIQTDVDKLNLYIEVLINSLEPGIKDGQGIYWKVYSTFFIAMKEKGLINTFAHIASITSGNEENIKWINENQDKMKTFYEWVNAYEWKK